MKFCFGLLFSLFIQISFCQEVSVPQNNLLNYLYNSSESIETIYTNPFFQNKFVNLENKVLNSYNQTFRKTSKNLFLLIEGTGRVYKATGMDDGNILFRRIDSTFFFGYNNGAILFPYLDTLFSFGGSGFWKRNGQLRYYSESLHEWNILKINNELPTLKNLYFIDVKNDYIFHIQLPYTEESTGVEHPQFIATKFDLFKKENTELGYLNNKIINLFPESFQFECINIPSLHGTLVNSKYGTQYLLNFDKNEVYRLANKRISDYFVGFSDNNQISNIFSISDTVFFTKTKDSTYKLYSFPISMSDFVKEPFSIYESIDSKSKFYNFYIGAMCILLFGGFIFYLKKKYTLNISTDFQSNQIDANKHSLDFSHLEGELISKIIRQSANGNHLSVEDLNSILGLNKKALEIQKKIRTETLNRINHKFKVRFNESSNLIERIRSEDDRRFYKYMISENNAKIVKKDIA